MAPQQLQHTLRLSGGNNKMTPKSTLGTFKRVPSMKKLAVLFFLLALIAVVMNVKFIMDMSPGTFGPAEMNVRNGVNAGGAAVASESTIPQAVYMNRMALLLGTMVICFGTIIYLFVKKVALPLDSVETAAREMSHGNLNISLSANPEGKLGSLGAAINDLAANYQEVLLLTGAKSANSISAVERIEEMLGADRQSSAEELRSQVQVIKQDLETLTCLVKDFEFYHARFDGRKVVPHTPAPKR